MERSRIAVTPSDMQAAQREMAKFEQREIEFRAAELHALAPKSKMAEGDRKVRPSSVGHGTPPSVPKRQAFVYAIIFIGVVCVVFGLLLALERILG
jgi:hypothetical protein